MQSYQPFRDPWITRDLTHEPGIQGFAKVCFGLLKQTLANPDCELVDYSVITSDGVKSPGNWDFALSLNPILNWTEA